MVATETFAGIVRLPVELRLTDVGAVAALLNETVQTDVAPGPSEVGLHDTPLRVGLLPPVWVAVPPVAVTVIALPVSDAPRAPDIPIVAEVAVLARVTETVATVPLAIMLELIPLARQMYAVAEPLQFKDFPAAVRADPAVTEKPVTEAAG